MTKEGETNDLKATNLFVATFQVDIEINDEPVDIHMKLDEQGAAFFVEDVSDSEDEEIPPELATSPIPEAGQFMSDNSQKSSSASPVNRSLIGEFNAVASGEDAEKEKASEASASSSKTAEVAIPESSSNTSLKGKLNRKKRKRRNNNRGHGHSRSGSKTSLKEIVLEGQQQDPNQDDIFQLDDNVNDGDLDDDDSETPVNSLTASTPMNKSSVVKAGPEATNVSGEQSFLMSRLGHGNIDEILDSQKKADDQKKKVAAMEAARRMDYYSEPEMTPMTSPRGSRPPSPVLSDTEYETKRQQQDTSGEQPKEQSWEWGKLPNSSSGQSDEDDDSKTKDLSGEGEAGGKVNEQGGDQEQKSWTWSFFKSRKEKKKEVPGVYLDDLKDDEEMMAIYVGSRRGAGGQMGNNLQIDDDAESGKGPSLPMSPHSVEGAIGGGEGQIRQQR